MSFFSNLMSGLGAAGGAMSQSFEEIQRQDLARAEARAREMATNRQLQQRANESLMNFESDRRERQATQQRHLETTAAGVARDQATLDYRAETAEQTRLDRLSMRELVERQGDDAREDARLARREDEDYIFFDDDKKIEISLANAAVRGADGDLGVAITRFLSMTEGQGFTDKEAERAVRIANERGQMLGFTGSLERAGPVVEEEEKAGLGQRIGAFFGGGGGGDPLPRPLAGQQQQQPGPVPLLGHASPGGTQLPVGADPTAVGADTTAVGPDTGPYQQAVWDAMSSGGFGFSQGITPGPGISSVLDSLVTSRGGELAAMGAMGATSARNIPASATWEESDRISSDFVAAKTRELDALITNLYTLEKTRLAEGFNADIVRSQTKAGVAELERQKQEVSGYSYRAGARPSGSPR